MAKPYKDWTGYKSEHFEVIKQAKMYIAKSGSCKVRQWECLCECGNSFIIQGVSVPKQLSCGCIMPHRNNWVNKRFGKMIVLEFKGTKGNSGYWLCKCDYGKEKTIATSYIKFRNDSLSCGCFRKKHNLKKDPKESSWNKLVTTKRTAAINNGKDWLLTAEHTRGLLSGNCSYCNSKPDRIYNLNITLDGTCHIKNEARAKKGWIKYSGIDRVDSSKGYIEGNVVSCCFTCNRAKNDMTLKEFEIWIKQLVEFRTQND